MTRTRRPSRTSTRGRARSKGRGWTPSSSPRPDAARRSRTTASCSAPIPPTPKRRSAYRRSPATSRSTSRPSTPANRPVRPARPSLITRRQQIKVTPKALLAKAGFNVSEVAEGHLCCGSAGTYNILQPEIARRLRDRKVANIEATGAEIIAAGNIGCLTPDRQCHEEAGGPYGRAARLGLWRPKARRAPLAPGAVA